jgi:proteasome lid subunit RPN8/RPN11
MIAQANAELPNECCGLLAGKIEEGIGRVKKRYPLVNEAQSPVRFLSDPASLLAAHRDCRNGGLEFLAVYHSHPTSEPRPSKTDLAMNYWPDLVSLIVSLQDTEAQISGWWLFADHYDEADWEVIGDTR